MAAAQAKLQDLQREITCGICSSYFSEPLTISCGHSFCRKCLSSCWTLGPTPFSCPECRQVSQVRELPGVNFHLANLTEQVKQLFSLQLQSAEGQHQCSRHKLMFQFFCEDDQTPLCERCSQSPKHGSHKLSPIQEAAHKCREKLRHLGKHLQKHLEEAGRLLRREQRPAVDRSWMVTGEYNKLHQFLVEEESQCLERMTQEQRAEQDRLSVYVHTLRSLILDLQEAGQQPNVDLLWEVKQLLGRSASVLSQRVKAVIPELKEYPIPGMIEILSRFTVALTIDASSANGPVIVSEDLKSVKAAEGWLVVTKPPEDAGAYYVFAEQAFSSGRQYWEVDVTLLPQWILGIHSPQIRRKRARNEEAYASKFLLCCVKKGGDYYLQTYPGALNHRLKSPVLRVGVYLEYSFGTLAFYNVLRCSPIYKFYSIHFTAPVTPIFSPGPPLPGTEAGPMTLCPVDSHVSACSYSSL